MKLSDFASYNDNPFNTYGVNIKRIVKQGETFEVANVETGEVDVWKSNGVEVTFNKDALQFVKVFNGALDDIKEFSSPALKIWCYIIRNLTPNKDDVYFDMKECLEYTQYDSRAAIYKGICELISKGFIARKVGVNTYFINPNKFFNGKRTETDRRIQPLSDNN